MSSDEPASNKLGRLIQRHGLSDLREELITRWTAPQDERSSLRDLADYVNQQLLGAHLEAANVTVTDYDLVQRYHRLTSDEVPTSDRTRERRTLERQGVDVDQLFDEFVSHQTVHTYLTDDCDVEYTTANTSAPSETVGQLKGRVSAVTDSIVDQLEETPPEYDVFVDITVYCHGCERRYTIEELIEADGCACASPAE